MESKLNRVTHAFNNIESSLNMYEAVYDDIAQLELYLNSKEWRQDHIPDEAGLLPKDLKRGVLSEDGIFNQLEKHKELLRQMYEISQRESDDDCRQSSGSYD